MNRYALFGAAAAIVIALVGGGLLLSRHDTARVGGPSPNPISGSPSPLEGSPNPGPSLGLIGFLDTNWVSHRHGYSVGYPGSWTVRPATADWPQGKRSLWNDPELDTLSGTDARLVAASQPLGAGKTAHDWYVGYCGVNGGAAASCPSAVAQWLPIQIGSTTGYVDANGDLADNGIVPGGVIFDAVAVAGDRGYEFTLDGKVDRTSFDRLLAGVNLVPAGADRVARLTTTFTSGIYGYGLLRDPAWTTTKATVQANDPRATDQNSLDVITVTGTDTVINVSATAMPAAGYQAWAVAQHQAVLSDNPSGCDGGDPATWPIVEVGDQQGHVDQWCNAAEVSVPVGDKVYVFDWSNATFSVDKHLGEAQFFRVLEGVTFAGTGSQSSPSS